MTTTTIKRNTKRTSVEAMVAGDRDLMKSLLKEALQEVLEGEMTEFLGAAPGERTEERQGYPKLVDWTENNIGETLTFYRLPRAHHKHMKSTNMLERLNEEIKRRTHVVRIFPNVESCLRLTRALCVETHETWLEDHRYLNMTLLAEQKKELLRLAA